MNHSLVAVRHGARRAPVIRNDRREEYLSDVNALAAFGSVQLKTQNSKLKTQNAELGFGWPFLS